MFFLKSPSNFGGPFLVAIANMSCLFILIDFGSKQFILWFKKFADKGDLFSV